MVWKEEFPNGKVDISLHGNQFSCKCFTRKILTRDQGVQTPEDFPTLSEENSCHKTEKNKKSAIQVLENSLKENKKKCILYRISISTNFNHLRIF